jgi:hypothetical protein
MTKFKGFTDSETFTQLPDKFFHQLLKEIKDTDELKVTLYLLWRAEHMEGPFRALSRMDFDVKELGLGAEEVTRGLEKAVKRGGLRASPGEGPERGEGLLPVEFPERKGRGRGNGKRKVDSG